MVNRGDNEGKGRRWIYANNSDGRDPGKIVTVELEFDSGGLE